MMGCGPRGTGRSYGGCVMSAPHRSRLWLIRAVCAAALGAACCVVLPVLTSFDAKEAVAADATDAALPRFVDVQGLDSLRHALLSPPAHAHAATADAIMPRFSGATGPGEGVAAPLALPVGAGQPSAMSLVAPAGQSNGDITTSHLQQTLTGARREAGETRELADEVRRRAEELTERFAGGSDQRAVAAPKGDSEVGTQTPPPGASAIAAATAGAPPAYVVLLPASPPPAAVSMAGNEQLAANDHGAADTTPLAGPLAGPTLLPPAGLARARGAVTQAEITPTKSAATRLVSKEVAAARSKAGTKPGRDVTATRLPVSEGKGQRKSGLATANATPAASAKPAKTAAAQQRAPASDKPPAGAAVAQAEAAPGARPEPAPAPKSEGGLLSWLKPFAFPKEIGALGWSTGE